MGIDRELSSEDLTSKLNLSSTSEYGEWNLI